jgi:hypothetical protein
MLTNEQKKLLKDQLLEKVKVLRCPMCKNESFTLADGYFSTPLQRSVSFYGLGGKAIPAIAIICDNCGFISQHAVGRLGLLDNKEENNPNEPK